MSIRLERRHLDIPISPAETHKRTMVSGMRTWFGWDGEHLHFSQTTDRQRYKNLNRDEPVAVSIVDPDPDFAFIDSMAQTFLGQEKYPWNQPGDERVVMVVAIEHTTQMGGRSIDASSSAREGPGDHPAPRYPRERPEISYDIGSVPR